MGIKLKHTPTDSPYTRDYDKALSMYKEQFMDHRGVNSRFLNEVAQIILQRSYLAEKILNKDYNNDDDRDSTLDHIDMLNYTLKEKLGLV